MSTTKPFAVAFAAIDANNDGYLTRLELVTHTEATGQRFEGGPQKLFERDDTNGDGFISWREYSGPKGNVPPPDEKAPAAGAFSLTSDSSRISKWCRMLHSKRAAATFCREDLVSSSVFGAAVVDVPIGALLDEDAAAQLHLYPGAFVVRRGAQGGKPPNGCAANEAMTLLRVPPDADTSESSCDVQLSQPVSSLHRHLFNVTTGLESDAANSVELSTFATALAEAAGVCEGAAALAACKSAMQRASDAFVQSTSRLTRNRMLRAVAEVFASPARAGSLVAAYGCADLAASTYDEFTQCRVKLGGWHLDVNVYQRAAQRGNKGGGSGGWRCRTCGLHNHPNWFASAAIAGQVRYTKARPSCFGSRLPTFAELDRGLADAEPDGTTVDEVGARYTLTRSEVAWETTEVLDLTAGQSLTFSPSWFHRVVPPAKDATHVPLTLMVKHEADLRFTRKDRRRERPTYAPPRSPTDRPDHEPYVLEPHAANVPYSDAAACWGAEQLAAAMRGAGLDRARGVRSWSCPQNSGV